MMSTLVHAVSIGPLQKRHPCVQRFYKIEHCGGTLEDGRIVTVGKPSLPDAEQAQVSKILGIDWKRAFPAVKSELKATAIL